MGCHEHTALDDANGLAIIENRHAARFIILMDPAVPGGSVISPPAIGRIRAPESGSTIVAKVNIEM